MLARVALTARRSGPGAGAGAGGVGVAVSVAVGPCGGPRLVGQDHGDLGRDRGAGFGVLRGQGAYGHGVQGVGAALAGVAVVVGAGAW
jgi:hypothetical protein